MAVDGPDAEIQTRDLTEQLLDEIREKLWFYTAAVFAVADGQPRYRGTVTCVTAGNQPYLLTAAHVWAAVQTGEQFALSLEADRILIGIRRDFVDAFVLPASGEEAQGPDLALIRLPSLIATDIGSVKAFYNLDRRRAEAISTPVLPDHGLWAIIGAPEEQSKFGAKEATLRISLFGSGIDRAYERDGYDYLEMGFNHENRPDLPRSYGGLSGSGLWQIALTKSASTRVVSWTGAAQLEGVAFFQHFTSASRGVIRCHGRKSIYVQALQRIGAR